MKKTTISIIKKLTCTTFCALLLSANFALIALADEDNEDNGIADTRACALNTETQQVNLIILEGKYSDVNIPRNQDGQPILAKPDSLLSEPQEDKDNWEASSDPQRNQYCRTIQYLQEYIDLAKTASIADCRAQSLSNEDRRAINDARCTALICNEQGNITVYYNNSKEAQAMRRAEQLGEVTCGGIEEAGPVAQCFYKLPDYIAHCNECKVLIDQHIQIVSRGGSSDINLQVEIDGRHVDCQRYSQVGSCSTAFSCSDTGTPTIQTYEGRIPFATEFFDVSDPQTGFGAGEGTQFRADAEGGPIVNTINTLANFLARMIATLSLLVFVIGSFILITANGDENQINRGKDAIKYSILGIFIVMLSYTIVVLIQSIFF